MTDIYARLGVKRRINAAGTLTRLGGSLMPDEVLAAMREAATAFVDIAELQAAASAVIAEHTGAEAGIVTSGAAAALTLGTAACLTGFDAARMDRLPDTSGMANEVVIWRAHRTGYDHAIRAAGARLVEIGYNDRATGAGVRGLEPWEIEAAIGPATVAVAYTATPAHDPPLAEVVKAAKGLPVIVDASAQLPPADNLTRYINEGAALVVFSGGKALRGPQASGILCGRRELVAAALVQQLDMDVSPATWRPPSLIPRDKLRGIPHHGIGRGFKVGKEEIAGLIAALERFATLDHEAERAARLQRLEVIAAALPPEVAHVAGEVLELSVADAYGLSRELQDGDPPIHLGEARAHAGVLLANPLSLGDADATIVAERLRTLLGRS